MGCGASQSAAVVHTSPLVKSVTTSAYVQTDPWDVDPLMRALPDTEEAAIGAQSDLWEPPSHSSETTPLVQTEVVPVATKPPQMKTPKNTKGKSVKGGIEDTWHAVCETLDVPKGQKNPNANLVVKRTGWKTIRVFVSSTFKDFQFERETLVKEVCNYHF